MLLRRQHIRLKQRIMPPNDIPSREVLTNDKPPLHFQFASGRMLTVHSGTAHIGGILPNQLGKMARLLGEARGLMVIVFAALVDPSADSSRGVGVSASEVFPVGSVLTHVALPSVHTFTVGKYR